MPKRGHFGIHVGAILSWMVSMNDPRGAFLREFGCKHYSQALGLAGQLEPGGSNEDKPRVAE
jgi:hypothetical protein